MVKYKGFVKTHTIRIFLLPFKSTLLVTEKDG